MLTSPAFFPAWRFNRRGRGNKSGQARGVRVFKTNHSLSAGIDAVDFAARPEILPRRRRLNCILALFG